MTAFHHRDARRDDDLSVRVARRHNLLLRFASAAVMAPLAIACAFVGGWAYVVVCTVAAAIILWEWTQLVADGETDARILAPGCVALAAAALLAFIDHSADAAALSIGCGAVLAGAATVVFPPRAAGLNRAGWGVMGVIYAGVALLSPILLRLDPRYGWIATSFLMAIVWTTDVCAYFVGRAVGGVLLWPQVSPNKTWSGAVGGTAGGVAAGIAVAYASGLGKWAPLGVVALALSIVAQVGDLLESAIKRRFGAKDASHLIPGHGGLMDRLDGFLAAALVALLIGLYRLGTDAPAQGLLTW